MYHIPLLYTRPGAAGCAPGGGGGAARSYAPLLVRRSTRTGGAHPAPCAQPPHRTTAAQRASLLPPSARSQPRPPLLRLAVRLARRRSSRSPPASWCGGRASPRPAAARPRSCLLLAGCLRAPGRPQHALISHAPSCSSALPPPRAHHSKIQSGAPAVAGWWGAVVLWCC